MWFHEIQFLCMSLSAQHGRFWGYRMEVWTIVDGNYETHSWWKTLETYCWKRNHKNDIEHEHTKIDILWELIGIFPDIPWSVLQIRHLCWFESAPPASLKSCTTSSVMSPCSQPTWRPGNDAELIIMEHDDPSTHCWMTGNPHSDTVWS